MSIESVMPSNHLILSSLLLLPSNFPSITVFSNESVLCIRWPKYWIFSFGINPFNEYSRLISFRIDWFIYQIRLHCQRPSASSEVKNRTLFLAVQGTLKSLLQYHSSKASILWCSAFFIVQLSHPYMINGKIIVLTRWTLVSK